MTFHGTAENPDQKSPPPAAHLPSPSPSPSPTPARPGWCGACQVGFRILAGRCVRECPPEGYYEGVSNNTAACLDCYYSCATCSGPNDHECTSCYGDADLDESSGMGKYCHNKTLVFKIFSSSRWYYILSIG